MWVVKLGGSLGDSPTLVPWLRILANAKVAIVPGGGAFADTVRRVQQRRSFRDETAHAMAVLAMAQYGLMLKGLEPKLETAWSQAEVRYVLDRGKSVVWLPHPDDVPVAPSWEVTSDSLALWFAGKIGGDDLVLIKSTDLPPVEAHLGTLQALGVVDPAFDRFFNASKTHVWLCHRDRYEDLPAALLTPESAFTRIIHSGQ